VGPVWRWVMRAVVPAGSRIAALDEIAAVSNDVAAGMWARRWG